jgi:hypothetical protein
MRAVIAALLVAAAPAAAAPYLLLETVRGADKQPLMKAAPDGAMLPVLRPAAPRPVVTQAQRVLASGIAARLPALDAAARAAAVRKLRCPALPPSVFVLLSDEDGGFARHRFYVADEDGRTSLCDDFYVDVTADEASIASGEFEEVLAHEWGHVLLRRMLGQVPPTPSRKFHSVRTVTDPITAFDEGVGIHFQPLAAAVTETSGFRARATGTAAPRLADFWFSRQETWMREALVPAGTLVLDKQAPAADADPYKRWLADEASAALDPCYLKSGDQMVASEGVVATFLHKLLAADGAGLDERYRKLVAVLGRMRDWPKSEPALIAFVRAWGEVFPQEREAVTELFLRVTHGATASRDAARLAEQASCAGASGDIEVFLAARKEAQASFDSLLGSVLAGRTALGAALGSELWIANSAQSIAAAPWQGKRDRPTVLNLNTAREPELELAFAGTPLAGHGGAITDARRSGAFASRVDVVQRAKLNTEQQAALGEFEQNAQKVGTAKRE